MIRSLFATVAEKFHSLCSPNESVEKPIFQSSSLPDIFNRIFFHAMFTLFYQFYFSCQSQATKTHAGFPVAVFVSTQIDVT